MLTWPNFTPWTALSGGVLIGVATALLLLMNGRIAGMSGIISGLLNPRAPDALWRIACIAGMLLSPFFWRLFAPLPAIHIDSSTYLVIAGGLLVGFGTRLGSGCTSGHGICGLARLSPRSFIATLCFIVTGMLMVYVIRHVLNA